MLSIFSSSSLLVERILVEETVKCKQKRIRMLDSVFRSGFLAVSAALSAVVKGATEFKMANLAVTYSGGFS